MTDNNNNQQNQQPHGPLDQARDMAEQELDKLIDTYAAKVPGGGKFTDQAKHAVDGILDKLEQEGEKRMGGLPGGEQKQ